MIHKNERYHINPAHFQKGPSNERSGSLVSNKHDKASILSILLNVKNKLMFALMYINVIIVNTMIMIISQNPIYSPQHPGGLLYSIHLNISFGRSSRVSISRMLNLSNFEKQTPFKLQSIWLSQNYVWIENC